MRPSGSGRAVTPERGLLFVAIVGVLAWMAVPGWQGYEAPAGAVIGTVEDPTGEPVPGVPVFLFEAASLKPLGRTTTDERGAYAFPVVPARFHVLARPEDPTWLAAGWRFDLRSGRDFGAPIDLPYGLPWTVTVVDESGAGIAGAEVRAVAPPSRGFAPPAAADIALTDGNGRAELAGPVRLLIEVARPGSDVGVGPLRAFDRTQSGSGIRVVLPPAGG